MHNNISLKVLTKPLLFVLFFVSAICVYGQVVIGSGNPPKQGMLLELKANENKGTNADKGLLLPRVKLKVKDQLYPMFDENDQAYTDNEKKIHTGLIVYNQTNSLPEDLCPGPYVWNGASWDRLWAPCVDALEIECTDIYVTGYVGKDMSGTTPAIQIPYQISGTMQGPYTIPAGIIGRYDNIVAEVERQVLTSSSGFITVKFSGIPTSIDDLKPFSIQIGSRTCSIYLSTIQPPSDCPDGTTARGFVFEQGSKWYVVTSGTYSGYSVVQTIECNTEEEALSHPDALQYCGTQNTKRCIRLFRRDGLHAANINMTTRSSGWLGGILEYYMGCQTNIIAYSGSRIQCIEFNGGYLGAVNVSGGKGYMGFTNQVATMTTKPLR
ncbi:hypothetical protein D0T84_10885 [Dysgonomonas sp. 521]|uniref:hypothetical protein n=1 Tax=Dysgonomonas sp. 521 TaxID=2302932 RepID=UPI0013D4BB28|nr:hypothetical protein [Dysgonomonas sp. 521]NDV95416.1 hypothetical protein [Dysgonomonas sp. 521]